MTLQAIRDRAIKEGYGFTSFDLAGYHKSEGEAKFWQIEEWLQNALDIYDEIKTENNIIIGSSMGGYISLVFSMLRPNKIQGVIGLVPGFGTTFRDYRKDKPFVTDLDNKVKIDININDADLSFNFVDNPINIDVPYLAITGLKDDVVNYKSSLKVIENIKSKNAQACISKEGTHSTSAVDNIQTIFDFMSRL